MARSLSDAWCQNPGCENVAVEEVDISINKASDATRALCKRCLWAFAVGKHHGKMGGDGAPDPIIEALNSVDGSYEP
jgi:hypothetical protein